MFFGKTFTYCKKDHFLLVDNPTNINSFFDKNHKIIRTPESKLFAKNLHEGLTYIAEHVRKNKSAYEPFPTLDDNTEK
jgi:hypothetical protein